MCGVGSKPIMHKHVRELCKIDTCSSRAEGEGMHCRDGAGCFRKWRHSSTLEKCCARCIVDGIGNDELFFAERCVRNNRSDQKCFRVIRKLELDSIERRVLLIGDLYGETCWHQNISRGMLHRADINAPHELGKSDQKGESDKEENNKGDGCKIEAVPKAMR